MGETTDHSALSFSPENENTFSELLTRYPNSQAAVIPTLYLIQDQIGYISVDAMEYVARRLDLPPAKVLSVATFYTMFNRHPVGDRQINVCTGPPCALLGADRVVEYIEDLLGITVGQTTPDKKFTLKRVECLASCGSGPMLECNGRYHEDLTGESLDALFDRWATET
jgi:NADH-quinone oxidoreductase E subunit